MISTRLYKDRYTAKEYADLAVWCNQNGAVIADKGDYYEAAALPAPTLAERRSRALAMAQTAFAARRDAVRWVGGYGFDCAPEDITNFMAAYTPLLVAGAGSTQYKVWLTDSAKGIVTLTLDEMTAVYREVRASQLEAYAWYERTRKAIEAADSADALAAVLAEMTAESTDTSSAEMACAGDSADATTAGVADGDRADDASSAEMASAEETQP